MFIEETIIVSRKYPIKGDIQDILRKDIDLCEETITDKKRISFFIIDAEGKRVTNFPHKDTEAYISLDTIYKVISHYYGVTLEELSSKKRSRDYVLPRAMIAYFGKELGHSNDDIARYMGKHRTTAHYHHKTVKSMLETDKELIRDHKRIAEILGDKKPQVNGKISDRMHRA